jgi:hypothetical protein
MRKLVALALVVLVGIVAAASPAAAEDVAAERAAVVQVVSDAYVDGIHNFRDPAAIRKGFHPDFVMLSLKDGQLDKLPIEQWIARIEERNAKEPPPTDRSKRTTTAEYPSVDVTGTAAVVKVELTREGKVVFTDYLQLYRFADGWKIVGKSFYRHP